MSDPKRIQVIERRSPSGGVRDRVAGVEGVLKQGDDRATNSVTWNLKQSSLADLRPRIGDRYSDDAGVEWVITSAGALANGEYPCECSRQT